MKVNIFLIIVFLILIPGRIQSWQSQFVTIDNNNKIVYRADTEGNTIPDFSKVGYSSGEREIPVIKVVETIVPVNGDNLKNIQQAINRVADLPMDKNGFRGAILLKKGVYRVNGTITINHSGIILRGEGKDNTGTVIKETATEQVDLFCFKGKGEIKRIESSRTEIIEDFVPVGRKFVILSDVSSLQIGDSVLLCRPGSDNWIHDLKMDQIVEREGTRQWKASDYDLFYERIITSIDGNKVYLDNPIVMQMDKKYGGGYLIRYTFSGRIKNCGIENMAMESTFLDDTDENHGWNAIDFVKVEQGWVQNVESRYFGYSCVSINSYSRNISVLNTNCLEPKSQVTGGRRYSFNCNGQLNLFKYCYATEGRHDYVTGARVCGPNVFTRCKARFAHSDIGPHHRWASGTLYDMIDTDGPINVQDRGNWGSGHGWAGVTQVVWNCRASQAAVQSPWVSGKNYCIGLIGKKYSGRFGDRPYGQWEGINKPGIHPESLYEAQLQERLASEK